MCFGDIIGKGTFWGAYHKHFASQQPSYISGHIFNVNSYDFEISEICLCLSQYELPWNIFSLSFSDLVFSFFLSVRNYYRFQNYF